MWGKDISELVDCLFFRNKFPNFYFLQTRRARNSILYTHIRDFWFDMLCVYGSRGYIRKVSTIFNYPQTRSAAWGHTFRRHSTTKEVCGKREDFWCVNIVWKQWRKHDKLFPDYFCFSSSVDDSHRRKRASSHFQFSLNFIDFQSSLSCALAFASMMIKELFSFDNQTHQYIFCRGWFVRVCNAL